MSLTPAQIEDLNATWQHEDNSLSLTEARLRATLAFERRVDIIGAIPDERWDGQLAGIVRYDGADHFALHRSYLSVS